MSLLWSKQMQQIEVDFDVFKALTVLRKNENHTYNQVIRDLLGLGEIERKPSSTAFSRIAEGYAESLNSAVGLAAQGLDPSYGFHSRGVALPNGTVLRAKYRGNIFRAEIVEGRWLAEDGSVQTSPSGAARAITGTNVNGLRFWEGKRPSDMVWRKLETFGQVIR
jgi:hypothetical protein